MQDPTEPKPCAILYWCWYSELRLQWFGSDLRSRCFWINNCRSAESRSFRLTVSTCAVSTMVVPLYLRHRGGGFSNCDEYFCSWALPTNLASITRKRPYPSQKRRFANHEQWTTVRHSHYFECIHDELGNSLFGIIWQSLTKGYGAGISTRPWEHFKKIRSVKWHNRRVRD